MVIVVPFPDRNCRNIFFNRCWPERIWWRYRLTLKTVWFDLFGWQTRPQIFATEPLDSNQSVADSPGPRNSKTLWSSRTFLIAPRAAACPPRRRSDSYAWVSTNPHVDVRPEMSCAWVQPNRFQSYGCHPICPYFARGIWCGLRMIWYFSPVSWILVGLGHQPSPIPNGSFNHLSPGTQCLLFDMCF
jgi:hypothetical protein